MKAAISRKAPVSEVPAPPAAAAQLSVDTLIGRGHQDIESVVRAQAHKTDILSAEEERELILAWHERRDMAARDKLILAHLKCVLGIARRFQRSNVSIADLIHEGVIGLIVACDKFEADRKNRFSTYAQWWVMTTLQEYMDKSVAPVKMGKTRIEKAAFSLLNKAKRRYGAPLSTGIRESIAEKLGIEYADLVKIESSMDLRSFSLNQTMGDDEGGETFLDSLVDEAAGPRTVYAQSLAAAHSRHIEEVLPRLEWRQQLVIRRRFMTEPTATLKELADELNISPERVRQIQMEGMIEMRRHFETAGLLANDLFGDEH